MATPVHKHAAPEDKEKIKHVIADIACIASSLQFNTNPQQQVQPMSIFAEILTDIA